ncbi:helix-turn-helix transcriptional regulator [Microcoleus sp. FACHB-1515]|uniref:helix-turn-helix transcriptional regulator n=1 Tax=Cyanophyceae TaxID=3028117 RepID=UPI0016837D5B|nr:helix-turn-helix transcriptional regulator [Microcoleus sp. FACHB-1515]MBD2090156.1 helix-turn-helix transcriptional regulator [Microcoleus sp. FACHB-1515]
MSLGEKLAERRKALKLTRLQVALAVGVVESSVKNWETGRHVPKLYPTQMEALCNILGFTLEELAEMQRQD